MHIRHSNDNAIIVYSRLEELGVKYYVVNRGVNAWHYLQLDKKVKILTESINPWANLTLRTIAVTFIKELLVKLQCEFLIFTKAYCPES